LWFPFEGKSGCVINRKGESERRENIDMQTDRQKRFKLALLLNEYDEMTRMCRWVEGRREGGRRKRPAHEQ